MLPDLFSIHFTAQTPKLMDYIMEFCVEIDPNKIRKRRTNNLVGKISGKGVKRWPDGRFYEGEFENNQMNGKGKMVWPDQSRFEGNFKNGKASGNGVEYMSNGDKFTGQF